MLIDEALPEYDVNLVRSVSVDADARTTFDAIEDAEIGEDAILRGIGWLRRLPERALAYFEDTPPEPEDPSFRTIGELFDREGLVRLGRERPRELLVGAVGRFWDPTDLGLQSFEPEAFEGIDEPGMAKGVVDITVHPRGDERCLLVLEARARGLDEESRQALTRYGSFVKPAAALVARRALEVVKARAEAGPDAEPQQRQVPEPTPAQVAAATGQLPTLDDVDVEGRRVLLRLDADDTVGASKGPALRPAADTVRTLLNRDAGVVVLAHRQARDGSVPDLEPVADDLAELLDHDVTYTPHIGDDPAQGAAAKVRPGEILLLGNVLAADGETDDADPEVHAQRPWVQGLAQAVDLYVNDAFPVAHERRASLVGFPELLPSVAGPNLVREIDAVERFSRLDEPRVLALGGDELSASLDVVAHQLTADDADQVLAGGLLGLLFLEADGFDTGEGTRSVIEDHGGRQLLRRARTVLDDHREAIRLPSDVGVERSGERLDVPVDGLPARGRIKDVGPDTTNEFADRIRGAEAALVHGPMGVTEQPPFDRGTHGLLAGAADARGYTVVAGGTTLAALATEHVDGDGFDHTSQASASLLACLAGDRLPAVEVLYPS